MKDHNIPVGSLVEVTLHVDCAEGTAIIGRAKMYVAKHGTRGMYKEPAYWLSPIKSDALAEVAIIFNRIRVFGYYIEEELTVLEDP